MHLSYGLVFKTIIFGFKLAVIFTFTLITPIDPMKSKTINSNVILLLESPFRLAP